MRWSPARRLFQGNHLRQSNPLGHPVVHSGALLAELYANAMAWSSEFRQVITTLALNSGCRLEVPAGREFDGIKDPERAIQKICRVYGGQCDRVLDLLRATIVADDAEQMLAALKLLQAEHFNEKITITMCRVKNKFAQAKVNGGFRSIHVNLMLKRPDWTEPGFICELQIQHRRMWEVEHQPSKEDQSTGASPHSRYVEFRNDRAE